MYAPTFLRSVDILHRALFFEQLNKMSSYRTLWPKTEFQNEWLKLFHSFQKLKNFFEYFEVTDL